MKFDGHQDVPLSLSQIKQIGGRAGRYGLVSDTTSGVVTCLKDQDLEPIRRAFTTVINKPIKRAVIPMPFEVLHRLQQAIPQPATFVGIFDIVYNISTLNPMFTIRDSGITQIGAEYIDSICPDISLSEKHMLLGVPIPWTDNVFAEAMVRIMRLYQNRLSVSLSESLRGLGMVEVLDDVTKIKDAKQQPHESMDTLRKLEGLHKLLVCYLWLHYHAPITFEYRTEAQTLKKKTEDAIDYCLAGIVSKKILSRLKVDAGVPTKEDKPLLPLLHSRPQTLSYEGST